MENTAEWNLIVQQKICIRFNNSFVLLRTKHLSKELNVIKYRNIWNPNDEFGREMLEKRPPHLTDKEKSELVIEYVKDLEWINGFLSEMIEFLVFDCTSIFTILKIA